MLESILIAPIWYLFGRFSNYFIPNKSISNNFIHTLHALFFVILYNIDLKSYALDLTSAGFYLYDLIYIIYKMIKTLDISTFPFVIHHCIAIYGYKLTTTEYFRPTILYIYYILELSNFSLYLTYYIYKKYPKEYNLKILSQCFQFLWYTYFRVILLFKFSHSIQDTILGSGLDKMGIFFCLKLMGLYWSFNLFNKCVKDLYGSRASRS